MDQKDQAAADGAAATEEQPISIEDALGGALDALDSDGAAGEIAEGSAADDAAGTGDGDEAAAGADDAAAEGDDDAKKTAARERNPDGTFKAREGESDEERKAAEDAAKAEAEAAKAAKDAATETQPQMVDGRDITKPPTSWKPEAATEFAKLPEAVRKEIHKREEDIHRGIEQYRGAAQFGADVAKRFQPYQQMLEQTKIAPTELVDAALQFEYTMRTGNEEARVALIKNLAKSYGLDIDGAEVKQAEVDPRYQALEQKYNQLEGKLTEREKREQDEAKRVEDTARAEVQKEITAFANDPKNEFYGQVQDEMLKLIQSGQGADLRDAYDKAIWINPVTREKLIARQRETERKSAADKAAVAKKANLANVTPRATPSGKTSGTGTMEDALGSALDQVMSTA